MVGGLEGLMKQIVAAFSGSGSGGGSYDSRQQVIDYLKDKGYSNESVAGIVGNIDVESVGSFDYTQKEIDHYDKNNKPIYKKNGGYGLFQFDGDTKKRYNDYLNTSNKKDSMESQIDFMDEMVKGNIKYYNKTDKKMVPVLGYGNVGEIQDTFLNETDPSEISLKFSEIFEKPEKGKEHNDKRSESALSVYESFNPR